MSYHHINAIKKNKILYENECVIRRAFLICFGNENHKRVFVCLLANVIWVLLLFAIFLTKFTHHNMTKANSKIDLDAMRLQENMAFVCISLLSTLTTIRNSFFYNIFLFVWIFGRFICHRKRQKKITFQLWWLNSVSFWYYFFFLVSPYCCFTVFVTYPMKLKPIVRNREERCIWKWNETNLWWQRNPSCVFTWIFVVKMNWQQQIKQKQPHYQNRFFIEK